MVLYIYLMQSSDSSSWTGKPVGGASANRSPVNSVNAHLRMIPRDLEDFRVVVTFHRASGTLCEAELSSAEASLLKGEIERVLNQGRAKQCQGKAALCSEVQDG